MKNGSGYGKLLGSTLEESLVSEGVPEIVSSDGILGWNVDGKLEGSYLGESLGPEGGTDIGSYDGM